MKTYGASLLFMISLLVINPFIAYSAKKIDMDPKFDTVKETIQTNFKWVKTDQLYIEKVDIEIFKNHSFYKAKFRENLLKKPIFIVAIGGNNGACAFFDYKSINDLPRIVEGRYNPIGREVYISTLVSNFSELAINNDLWLSWYDFDIFVDSFILLVDHYSKRVENVKQIDFIKNTSQNERDKLEKVIQPLEIEYGAGRFYLSFFSWRRPGTIQKWELVVISTGKILSFKNTVILCE